MRKINDGWVFTNENCIACNRCITTCPVLGANINITENGKAKVVVSSTRCIHCGNCLKTCRHQAREYRDDIVNLFSALKNGEKISLLVAPSFYFAYGEEAKGYLGYLKTMGVNKIYDVSFGAQICVWAHVRYLDEHENDVEHAYLGQSCATLKNILERKEPELLKSLIPVQSPMGCMAIYARKYLKDDSKLAFIGPCMSKFDEVHDENLLGNVDYCVTFDHLEQYLAGADLSSYSAEADITVQNSASIFPLPGSFRDIIKCFFPSSKHITSYDALDDELIMHMKMGQKIPNFRPFFSEILSCRGGCISGPGIPLTEKVQINLYRSSIERHRDISEETDNHNYLENRKNLYNFFKDYEYSDFTFEPVERYQQSFHVPDSVCDGIFNAMHKDTEEKRHIDCGSCGYKSCYNMVKAIAYGYNKMENCIHYVNDEIIYRYYTDELTKLYNKQGFLAKARKILDEHPERRYVLGFASVNQMNIINDLCGFEAGDKVIKLAAEIASNFVGETGVAARYAGSKFLMLFELDEEHGKRLSEVGFHDVTPLGIAFPVSYRAGLYLINDPTISVDKMINYAFVARDKIVTTAESSIMVYDGDLEDRLARESMVTSEMYNALENKEFVSFFQPQYDHVSGKLVGAESLCRWIKPDGTMISPGLFIPIFERNGFIYNLDKYMWENAFITIRKWLDEGKKVVPISVNISRISINRSDFVDIIERLGAKYAIPTEYLHFEVTESAYSESQLTIIERVNAIRSMGYEVAMDDFGSGYSSLNTLKDVPIDILKLDMGFLRGQNRKRGETIIENVVQMVLSLGLDMVAEGVETREQADFLAERGCSVIQGYYYSKPLPQSEFEERL